MATVNVTLPPTFEPNTPKNGAFSFSLERDVLDGTSIQRHCTDEGVDAVDGIEVARESILPLPLPFASLHPPLLEA